jgi:SAM-dependent methyltransferase
MNSTCRSCHAPLSTLFVDLGSMPISNAFRKESDLSEPELTYPLRAYVCDECKLVQLEDVATRDTHFHNDYVYFSSVSSSWMEHARHFSESVVDRLALSPQSRVVELASNDGYLLRNFVQRGIPSLGIDPAANCADEAARFDVETRVAFFGKDLAEDLVAEGWQSDLIVGNNVLAHVPDVNDFVAGMALLLKPEGVISLEFPHLLQLMLLNQFDTIYHEHYSYLSTLALRPLFDRHGLEIIDVERLSTHGGSLRLYVSHAGRQSSAAVGALLDEERDAGLGEVPTYRAFGERVMATKRALLRLLIELKDAGKTIVGYGAPAKANTLLNYCGIGRDFLDYTVDLSPSKQGTFLPGSNVPVLAPEAIRRSKPDFVLILPWNIEHEIREQWSEIAGWGGKFVLPSPTPRIVD